LAQSPAVVSLIGGTPLVPLSRAVVGAKLPPTITIAAKLEGFNPGGSVKDRPALSIVCQALRSGELGPGRVLLDATSGNTGIAYALLGAALHFPVHLVLPANASPERVQILRAYGAELTLSDPQGGTDGARALAREMIAAAPGRYFYADQYNHPANPLAHYCTTGPEIWQQTGGQITHFVAGMGTSGTMMGVGRYLKEQNPTIRLIGVQPTSALDGIEGLRHLATASPVSVYEPDLVDQTIEVSSASAQATARRLARQEGLFVGLSAGAAVAAALQVGQELTAGYVVALLPDGGFKYASAPFWLEP